MTNPWGYLLGILIGSLFIGVVAPTLVDFRGDSNDEGEAMSEDDVEIAFV